MIYPDEIPMWVGVPVAVVMALVALAPVFRDIRRSRRH